MNDAADVLAEWTFTGAERIANPERTYDQFPFVWDEQTPFRQTFEYCATAFESEVGFYTTVFGLEIVALDATYVLFTTARRDFWFSVRKATDDRPSSNPTGLCLMFMSKDFPGVRSYLDLVGEGMAVVDRVESSGQHVARFQTPAGLAIEVWEDPA